MGVFLFFVFFFDAGVHSVMTAVVFFMRTVLFFRPAPFILIFVFEFFRLKNDVNQANQNTHGAENNYKIGNHFFTPGIW